MLDKHRFGHDGTGAAGTREPSDGRHQMQKKDGQIAHRAILARLRHAQEFLTNCGIRHAQVTWLTLRRTYSSWVHEKGVPGKVVAQLMGHVKVDTTLNVYTQVIDGALRAAVDKVGSELFTIRKRPRR